MVTGETDSGLARAIELAEEFGMTTVLVGCRPELDDDLRAAVLEEARLELVEVFLSGDWPLWHEEVGEDHVLMVADGAPVGMHAALLELEASHDIGDLWRLELVVPTDGPAILWQQGRAEPRQPLADVAALLDGYEWSQGNGRVGH